MVIWQVQNCLNWLLIFEVFQNGFHLVESYGLRVGSNREVLSIRRENGSSDGLSICYFMHLHHVLEGVPHLLLFTTLFDLLLKLAVILHLGIVEIVKIIRKVQVLVV